MNKNRITFSEVWEILKTSFRSFGVFPLLFLMVVGGPSVLVIAEAVFDGFRLVDSLQWIVDGWSRVNRIFGKVLEPITTPIVNWINSLGLTVELHQHWQSLFWLLLMPLISVVRAIDIETTRTKPHLTHWFWHKLFPRIFLYTVVGVPLALGAFVAGLTPASNSWYSQGLIVFLPIVTAAIGYTPISFLMAGLETSGKYIFRPIKQLKKTLIFLFYALTVGLVSGSLASMLSIIPGVTQSALLMYATLLLVLGLFMLFKAITAGADGVRSMLYASLGLLGGFFAASMVIVANIVLSLLGH